MAKKRKITLSKIPNKEELRKLHSDIENKVKNAFTKRIKQGYVFSDIADFVTDDVEQTVTSVIKTGLRYFRTLKKMEESGYEFEVKAGVNKGEVGGEAFRRMFRGELQLMERFMQAIDTPKKDRTDSQRAIIRQVTNKIRERMAEVRKKEESNINELKKEEERYKESRKKSKRKRQKEKRYEKIGLVEKPKLKRTPTERVELARQMMEFQSLKRRANEIYMQEIKRGWLDKTRKGYKRVKKIKGRGRTRYAYRRKRKIEKFKDWLTLTSVYGEYQVVPMYDPKSSNIMRPQTPTSLPRGYKQGLNPEFVKVVEKQQKPGYWGGRTDKQWGTSGLRNKVLTIKRHSLEEPSDKTKRRLKYRGVYLHLPLIYDVGTSKKGQEGLNFLQSAYKAAQDYVRSRHRYALTTREGETYFFEEDPTAERFFTLLRQLEKFTGGKRLQEIKLDEFLESLGFEVIRKKGKKAVVNITPESIVKKL